MYNKGLSGRQGKRALPVCPFQPASIQKITQLVASARMAQLAERLRFNLTDTLTGAVVSATISIELPNSSASRATRMSTTGFRHEMPGVDDVDAERRRPLW